MARSAKWPFVEKTPTGCRANVRLGGRRVKGPVRKGEDADRQAHEDALRLLDQRTAVGDRRATIADGYAIVEAALDREPETRPGTREFYASHLKVWPDALGAEREWRTVRHDEVQRIVDGWRSTSAPQTIRHRLAAATRVVGILGLTPNPFNRKTLQLPRQSRDRREPPTWEEVLDMLHSLRDMDARTELVVLGFIAGFGLRRGEFARLHRRHIDLRSGLLKVPADVAKTQPRELPVPESAQARILIEDLLDLNPGPPDGFVIPGDTERRRIEFLRNVVERARVLTGDDGKPPRLQLHGLRKAFASRLAQDCTVPVASALMGHALPGVIGRYVHADRRSLVEAMTALWEDFEKDDPEQPAE